MCRAVLMVALLGALGFASPAIAQGPVEIGAGAAFLGMVDMRGLKAFGPEVHVTVPLTARFGLDVSTTLGGQAMPPYSIPGALVEGGARHRTEGLYAAIHQRLASNAWSGFHTFVSYGLAGLFGATTQAKTRVTFPTAPPLPSPADPVWVPVRRRGGALTASCPASECPSATLHRGADGLEGVSHRRRPARAVGSMNPGSASPVHQNRERHLPGLLRVG